MEGITITSRKGGTTYVDKDGNEINPPQDEIKEEKRESEKPKRRDKEGHKE
jgi:hypothetical protein